MATTETLHMSTTEDDASDFRVITLNGPLVLRTLFEFQDLVRADNARDLILDLTQTEYMDSAGLGAILGAFASYQRRGRRLLLVGANSRIQTLLEVTHTDQFLHTFPTLEAAKQQKK